LQPIEQDRGLVPGGAMKPLGVPVGVPHMAIQADSDDHPAALPARVAQLTVRSHANTPELTRP
jgi:hypothetical protein